MRVLCVSFAMIWSVVGALPSHATTLRGVIFYSTDDFGNPSGYDWDREQLWGGELGRTGVHAHWYGLGLASGLPPDSLQSRPLNAPDFSVEIPLVDGENNFTLLATYGTGTEWDAYFALSLYFDGDVRTPGLSVLFPRTGTWDAAPPIPNMSEFQVTHSVGTFRAAPAPDYYDDGIVRVSVVEIHFLPDSTFPGTDLISKHAVVPGDGDDRIGILRLLVEPLNPTDPDLAQRGVPGGSAPPPGSISMPSVVLHPGAPYGAAMQPSRDSAVARELPPPVQDSEAAAAPADSAAEGTPVPTAATPHASTTPRSPTPARGTPTVEAHATARKSGTPSVCPTASTPRPEGAKTPDATARPTTQPTPQPSGRSR